MRLILPICLLLLSACSEIKPGTAPRTYIFVPTGMGMTMIPIYDPPSENKPKETTNERRNEK